MQSPFSPTRSVGSAMDNREIISMYTNQAKREAFQQKPDDDVSALLSQRRSASVMGKERSVGGALGLNNNTLQSAWQTSQKRGGRSQSVVAMSTRKKEMVFENESPEVRTSSKRTVGFGSAIGEKTRPSMLKKGGGRTVAGQTASLEKKLAGFKADVRDVRGGQEAQCGPMELSTLSSIHPVGSPCIVDCRVEEKQCQNSQLV